MATTPSRSAGQASRVAQSYLEQARALADWLATIPAEALLGPCVRSEQRCIDVVGYMLYQAQELASTLAEPSTGRPVPLLTYVRTMEHAKARLLALAQLAVGAEAPDKLVRELRQAIDNLAPLLAGRSLPDVVSTAFEPLRVVDLLRYRVLELVVCVDDLTTSLPEHASPIQRAALAEACRTLATMLGEKYPGQSVEVRVPPFAAVQISDGSGPTHRRGTPPTVVETTPAVFLRVACGRISFPDAVERGLITASGAHADLTPLFPLAP